MNPVSLLEIGRSSRLDTAASSGSDTSHLSCSGNTSQLDTRTTSSNIRNMPSASENVPAVTDSTTPLNTGANEDVPAATTHP